MNDRTIGAQTAEALDVAFLIVGTPRSGTTLVQRLACELDGVRVPPETHFFSLFAPDLLGRRSFPMQRDALRDEVARFAAMPTSDGLDLSVDSVVDALGDRCESPIELFSAIVAELSRGATVRGEKTTDHLVWWRPIAAALPRCRFIWVVRDPRAVVASNLRVPWGMSSIAALSERWAEDQRQLIEASRTLGPNRVLCLRYENVVANAAGARSEMARFLGIGRATATSQARGDLFLPWETWKMDAVGPIAGERLDAWRESLTPKQQDVVLWITRAIAPEFGYPGGRRRPTLAAFSLSERFRRTHVRIARNRERHRLSGIRLAAPVVPSGAPR